MPKTGLIFLLFLVIKNLSISDRHRPLPLTDHRSEVSGRRCRTLCLCGELWLDLVGLFYICSFLWRPLPGVVHDCVEAVRYHQDSAVLKLRADGGLNQVVCLHVHGCCGLIQNQDLGLSQQSSGQAQQLPLAHTGGTNRKWRKPQAQVRDWVTSHFLLLCNTYKGKCIWITWVTQMKPTLCIGQLWLVRWCVHIPPTFIPVLSRFTLKYLITDHKDNNTLFVCVFVCHTGLWRLPIIELSHTHLFIWKSNKMHLSSAVRRLRLRGQPGDWRRDTVRKTARRW